MSSPVNVFDKRDEPMKGTGQVEGGGIGSLESRVNFTGKE